MLVVSALLILTIALRCCCFREDLGRSADRNIPERGDNPVQVVSAKEKLMSDLREIIEEKKYNKDDEVVQKYEI